MGSICEICVYALSTKPITTWPYFPCQTMPHLSQSKPEVIISNSSFPTAAKMCLNTLSYLLHSEVGMPSHSQQWRLHPWNCSRLASQVLHTNAAPNCFYPALSGCFAIKCTFSLLFFFSAHHVSSSVLTARD